MNKKVKKHALLVDFLASAQSKPEKKGMRDRIEHLRDALHRWSGRWLIRRRQST